MSDWATLIPKVEVNAKPAGTWTLATNFIAGGTLLMIRVLHAENAKWAYMPGTTCSPDGDATSLISRSRCILTTAPVGALIGKIGGSTASASDGTVFAVGSMCVVRLGDNAAPLYLTINDEESGMSNNDGTVIVELLQRTA